MIRFLACLSLLTCYPLPSGSLCAKPVMLRAERFSHYVERFNAHDREDVVNLIPNAGAWQWMMDQTPLLECPSPQLEQTYYFRWWTYRKHIKQTPVGRVLTEFLLPVTHAGEYDTISCALGHHIAEGRWLRDQRLLDEYVAFWFTSGDNGGSAKHFHKFSSWVASALYDRYLVTGNRVALVQWLDALVADYRQWERQRQRPDGLFWQYDVQDGMEESISGGRRAKNVRPTINSYMAANALAISKIANIADRRSLAEEFVVKHEVLRTKLVEQLWRQDARFYQVQLEQGAASSAREAIGFIPWMFNLAPREHAEAWLQLKDPAGFKAPWGLTTAERRHPEFRSHGVGTCEWDGAVWPFATSQTLNGLINLLRGPDQGFVNAGDFYTQLLLYADAHQQDGKPYIGEYYDELTGEWLIQGPKAARSRYYNHSTFNDLIIRGLAGIVPRPDAILEIDPLLPSGVWDWYCLDGVSYHGHQLTICWDELGTRYGRGKGLFVLIDGREIARSDQLDRITVKLPL